MRLAGERLFVFFFQAEDGIRDLTVTGVQTCALPIWPVPIRYRRSTVHRVLEYRLLGPLEVAGDRVVQLGGPKQRATLALLLLNPNRVVPVDRLADDLYAGAAPVTALKQVQRQISELRKALGSTSAIETRSPGYTIRLAPEQLDLTVFERLTAEALDAHEPEQAAGLLRPG